VHKLDNAKTVKHVVVGGRTVSDEES